MNFQETFKLTSGIYLFLNRVGEVVHASSAFRKLPELTGHPTADLVPLCKASLLEVCRRVYGSQENLLFEAQAGPGAGTRKHFQFEAIPSREGVMLVGLETTNRAREIEKLRRNERLLSDAQKTAKVGIWEWSLADQRVEWSPQLYEIYGLTPEMYEPSFEGYLSLVAEEDRDRVREVIGRAISEKSSFSHDEKVLRADGSLRHLHTWGHPELDASGEVTGYIGICQDITDRVRMEMKAHEAFQLYRQIFETAEEGIWIIDRNNVTTHVNKKMARILGYQPAEMIGKTHFEFMDRESRERTQKNMQKRRLGIGEQIEMDLRHKSGDKVWTIIGSSPLFDRDGAYSGAVGMVSDISRRVRSEVLLEAQKNVFEILINGGNLNLALNDIVFALEKLMDGRASILLVSEKGDRLRMGAAPSLPRSFSEAIDGMGIGPDEGACGAAAHSKEVVILPDLRSEEVRPRYRKIAQEFGLGACWSSPILTLNDDCLGTFAIYFTEPKSPSERDLEIVRDATAVAAVTIEYIKLFRKEHKSRKNGKLLADARKVLGSSIDYEYILKKIPEVIVSYVADWCMLTVIDEEGALVPIGGAGEPEQMKYFGELKGYRPDMTAPEGMPKAVRTGLPQLYPFITPDQLEPDPSTGWAIIGTRDPKYLELAKRLGLTSYMAVPILVRHRPVGALFIASSRSDRHYTPEDLEVAMELAHSCGMAMDNARLYKEAKSAVKAREEFISVASHELRTPLTSLKGRADLLATMLERNAFPKEVTQKLSPIIKGLQPDLENFAGLVESLLDVSRLGSARFFLKRHVVDISRVLLETVEKLKGDLDPQGTIVVKKFDPDIVASVDQLRIKQVLINLLTNALKFGKGAPIEVEIFQENSELQLAVRDQGIGISGKDPRRVFRPFERAVSERNFGGLGLGLYISNQIVEGHGGRFELESVPGKGSTFRAIIPL